MSKGDIAKQNFMNGYNCSQAVLLAFCEDFGLEKETALKISEPFGGGMGRMREVCGTVTGMFMVLGLAMGNSDAKDGSTKKNIAESFWVLKKPIKKAMCRRSELPNTIKSALAPNFASMRQIFLRIISRKKTLFKQVLLYKICDFVNCQPKFNHRLTIRQNRVIILST